MFCGAGPRPAPGASPGSSGCDHKYEEIKSLIESGHHSTECVDLFFPLLMATQGRRCEAEDQRGGPGNESGYVQK